MCEHPGAARESSRWNDHLIYSTSQSIFKGYRGALLTNSKCLNQLYPTQASIYGNPSYRQGQQQLHLIQCPYVVTEMPYDAGNTLTQRIKLCLTENQAAACILFLITGNDSSISPGIQSVLHPWFSCFFFSFRSLPSRHDYQPNLAIIKALHSRQHEKNNSFSPSRGFCSSV